MNKEKERPNWVEARANCTAEGFFDQLVDTIKKDVACYNNLPPHKRQHYTFKHVQPDTTTAYFGYV